MRSEEDIKILLEHYKIELAKLQAQRKGGSEIYNEFTELNIHTVQTSIGWLRWFLGEE